VLKKILASDDRIKLLNLINDVLPYVEDLNVVTSSDRAMLLTLQESYSKGKFLPANLLSDGTINVIALIIALFFEDNDLVIIEEPEKYLHPHLVSRLVNLMMDASKKKQIIVTTHNPEFVRHAGLENLLLVSRDEDGFSVVKKPAESEAVKVFLENELGIDELYVQNLLDMP